MLVKAGPQGMAAGEIARRLGSPANTMSANLAVLAQAGLVTATREGRSIRYAAAYPRMRALLVHLIEDCCQGHDEICQPLAQIVNRGACYLPSEGATP